MKTTFVLHVVQHTTQRFEQTCSTHLLQGGHSNFHNVPLVWEDLLPAPIDLVRGRGISNTAEDDDGFLKPTFGCLEKSKQIQAGQNPVGRNSTQFRNLNLKDLIQI